MQPDGDWTRVEFATPDMQAASVGLEKAMDVIRPDIIPIGGVPDRMGRVYVVKGESRVATKMDGLDQERVYLRNDSNPVDLRTQLHSPFKVLSNNVYHQPRFVETHLPPGLTISQKDHYDANLYNRKREIRYEDDTLLQAATTGTARELLADVYLTERVNQYVPDNERKVAVGKMKALGDMMRMRHANVNSNYIVRYGTEIESLSSMGRMEFDTYNSSAIRTGTIYASGDSSNLLRIAQDPDKILYSDSIVQKGIYNEIEVLQGRVIDRQTDGFEEEYGPNTTNGPRLAKANGPVGWLRAEVRVITTDNTGKVLSIERRAGTRLQLWNLDLDTCTHPYLDNKGMPADLEGLVTNCPPEKIADTEEGGIAETGVRAGNVLIRSAIDLPVEMPEYQIRKAWQVVKVSQGKSNMKTSRLVSIVVGDKGPSRTKSTKYTGSELWVYEPDYVIWDGTSELYPFVYESEGNWEVDVCLDPPEGYQVAAGVSCQQTIVAGEPTTIMFEVIEVGSVPDKTKVKMKLKDPKGKVHQHEHGVASGLTKKLAKKKGIKIDDHGRPEGIVASTHGQKKSSSTVGRFFKRLFGLD